MICFFSTSLETIRSSVKHLDIDYFLGHCCFVVTQGKLIFTKNFCLRQNTSRHYLSLCIDQLESSKIFLWKARSATLTNSCQPFLLSHLLSACESELFTLKHPPIKSQNTSIQLGRLAKSASNFPPQSGKVQILYPPGMDDRQITMGCPEREDVEASNWSAHYWE